MAAAVKYSFQGSLRRVVFDDAPTIASLRAQIATSFPGQEASLAGSLLTYTDGEDTITITTDDELASALEFASTEGRALRLDVTPGIPTADGDEEAGAAAAPAPATTTSSSEQQQTEQEEEEEEDAAAAAPSVANEAAAAAASPGSPGLDDDELDRIMNAAMFEIPDTPEPVAVSYTHLTLPTIYSV